MEEIASGPNVDQTQRFSVMPVLYSVEISGGDLLAWAHDVYIVCHTVIRHLYSRKFWILVDKFTGFLRMMILCNCKVPASSNHLHLNKIEGN